MIDEGQVPAYKMGRVRVPSSPIRRDAARPQPQTNPMRAGMTGKATSPSHDVLSRLSVAGVGLPRRRLGERQARGPVGDRASGSCSCAYATARSRRGRLSVSTVEQGGYRARPASETLNVTVTKTGIMGQEGLPQEVHDGKHGSIPLT